jgi:hypothetical protein
MPTGFAPPHRSMPRTGTISSFRATSGSHGRPLRGLITFETGSVGEAERLVAGDPFVRNDLLHRVWLKEWIAGGAEAVQRDLRTVGSGPLGR